VRASPRWARGSAEGAERCRARHVPLGSGRARRRQAGRRLLRAAAAARCQAQRGNRLGGAGGPRASTSRGRERDRLHPVRSSRAARRFGGRPRRAPRRARARNPLVAYHRESRRGHLPRARRREGEELDDAPRGGSAGARAPGRGAEHFEEPGPDRAHQADLHAVHHAALALAPAAHGHRPRVRIRGGEHPRAHLRARRRLWLAARHRHAGRRGDARRPGPGRPQNRAAPRRRARARTPLQQRSGLRAAQAEPPSRGAHHPRCRVPRMESLDI
jgi:hypothetical protein